MRNEDFENQVVNVGGPIKGRDGMWRMPTKKDLFVSHNLESLLHSPVEANKSEKEEEEEPPSLSKLLLVAPALYAHRQSEHPEVAERIKEVLATLDLCDVADRKGKFKGHLTTIVLDLWVAAKHSTNPWRTISKNKNDYSSKGRYDRMYMSYRTTMAVLGKLEEGGFIEVKKGYRVGERAFLTRIKATDKLLFELSNEAKREVFRKPHIGETIILRDKDKENIDYAETAETIATREQVERINKRLMKADIRLDCNDAQFDEIERRTSDSVDYTDKQLHRVFNIDFDHGGRFYGGWWQQIPKEYRRYITTNHQATVELDYSAHHFRLLYQRVEKECPDDPYDVLGVDRADVKVASLIILNAKNKEQALHALASEGVKNGKKVLEKVERKHAAISSFFYSGIGLELQKVDSDIMARVMERFPDAVVLPVHDSVIVRAGWQEDVEEAMQEEFRKVKEEWPAEARIKRKGWKTNKEGTKDFYNSTFNIY